ncbi:MAG: DUF2391 domain-containing protein, partial [Thermovibrio sp.]
MLKFYHGGKSLEINKDRENNNSKFQLKDLIQEIAGAMLLAFPFAANADIWELSRKMSFYHCILLIVLIIAGLYTIIEYGRLENWSNQNIIGILPLRLITILLISVVVSLLALLILGVYPSIIDNKVWLLKATIL